MFRRRRLRCQLDTHYIENHFLAAREEGELVKHDPGLQQTTTHEISKPRISFDPCEVIEVQCCLVHEVENGWGRGLVLTIVNLW